MVDQNTLRTCERNKPFLRLLSIEIKIWLVLFGPCESKALFLLSFSMGSLKDVKTVLYAKYF